MPHCGLLVGQQSDTVRTLLAVFWLQLYRAPQETVLGDRTVTLSAVLFEMHEDLRFHIL